MKYRIVERYGNFRRGVVRVRIERRGWLFWHTVAAFDDIDSARACWHLVKKFNCTERVVEEYEAAARQSDLSD